MMYISTISLLSKLKSLYLNNVLLSEQNHGRNETICG